MIEEINSYLKRFLFLGEDEATVLSAWVLHTWQFEVGRPIVTPYIYLNSPDSGYGKTVTLDVLATLTRNACKTASVTPSALYRQIDELQSTMLLDEIDTVFHGRKNEDMRNVINDGYKRGGKTIRTSGGISVSFSSFSPKLMAGIFNGALPATILDRCIPISLDRVPEGVELEYFADFLFEEDADHLLEKIMNWSDQNVDKTMASKFQRYEGLTPRQSEIIWPLVAVAEADGVDIVAPFRRLLAKFAELNRNDGLLGKIADYFDENKVGKVYLETLVDVLDMPVTLSNIKKLSAQIAEDYRVEAKSVRIQNSVRRGYEAAQFMDAFKKANIVMKNVAV